MIERSNPGLPAVAAPTSPIRIGAARVKEICGGVSDMAIWRWLQDPDLGFPQPVYIGTRRFWRQDEIVAWLDSRPRTHPTAATGGEQ